MLIGSYERLEQIGVGSTGEVYIAVHVETRDLVALKLAKRELMPEVELLFQQEHRIGRQLNHANILSSHDLGVHDGVPYLVTPLMESTLAERLDEHRTLEQIIELMVTLADAVQFAHDGAILHCDLKPANIFFDDQGRARIGDFGLARRITAPGTSVGEASGGTRGYMSPEQVEQTRLRVQSDVFTLGVLLYELCARRLPFGNDADFDRRVLEETLVSPFAPRRFSRKLEWELAAICGKALERRPENRFQSARELADDLERARSGESVSAEKRLPLRRAQKWARRHPIVALAAVGLLVVVLCAPFLLSAAAAEVRSDLRKQSEFSAVAQAGAVTGQLNDLAFQVEAMAEDPEVKRLLTHASIAVHASALAPHLLGFDSVNVFSADGSHQAREPVDAADRRENCAFKDFFVCAAGLARAPRSGAGKPSPSVCIARAHRSRLDRKVKLGISAPLFGDDGRFIGVVEASTKVRDRFGPIDMNCGAGDCWTALLGPRDRDSAGAPLPETLRILAQPHLNEGDEVPVPEAVSKRICAELGCTPGFEDAPRRPRGALSLEEYRDPLTNDAAVAAIAAVGRTGLSVLIATPHTAADARVQKLLGLALHFAWAPLLAGLGLVICVLAPRRAWRPAALARPD